MLYRLTLCELFRCQPDTEAYRFLGQYPLMVKWWLKQEKEPNQIFTAYRNKHYAAWKKDWSNYSSQHAQTSSAIAYLALKAKEKQNKQTLTELNTSFAAISTLITQIENEKLIFPTTLHKKAHTKLATKNSTQQTLLQQAENGYWQIGQTYLTHEFCVIPFTRYIDLNKEKDPFVKDLLK